ncbi:hypothetical protein F2Q68_00022471 [Brassica cretica]|uniref:Uncharacterized protein n=1 Tax=Brassica cretica TaxID=69181 RepID=A0A8S9FYX2_BRACR|nr:hypothetical protein F2Q68_00022471 [Brassica cretica]
MGSTVFLLCRPCEDFGVDELVLGMSVLRDISLLDVKLVLAYQCPVSNTPAAEKLRYPFAFVEAFTFVEAGAIALLSSFPRSSLLSLNLDVAVASVVAGLQKGVATLKDELEHEQSQLVDS